MIMLRTEIIVLNFLLNHFTCSNLINIFFSLVNSWIRIDVLLSPFFSFGIWNNQMIFLLKNRKNYRC